MDRKVPVHKMSKIRFYAYTSREIENLSVIQITNPETLNLLGHSSQGGLHDPALGPNSNNELCASCGLNSNSCPGHFGHIKLPLLVYNPFFFDTMYKLLRGSCFKCHCLLAPESAGHLLLAQLQALDHGLVGLSEELEQIALDGEDDKGNAQNLVLIEKLSAAVQSALGAIDCNEAMKSAHVKNVVDCKQKIIRNFQKQYLMSGSRKCPRCLMTQSGLAAYNKCKVVFTSKPSSRMQTKTPKKKSIRLKDDSIMNPEISDEEPNEEDLSQQNYLSPTEAHSHLKALWENEDTLLQRLFGSICNNNIYSDTPADIFFLDVVAVPPTKYRPMNLLNGMTSESPQTSNLKVVLKYSIVVRSLLCQIKKDENMMDDVMLEHVQLLIDRLIGKTLTEKLNAAWIQLQVVVNCVLDSELDKLNKKANPGVKQVLEKKEGLFRKHMMGKRVNYAARSVISPDPYIGVNEIGIPHVFATRLTYPQPVTPWNVQELKSMVINGPNIYPGATLIRNQDGSCIRLSSSDKKQREAVAKQLLTPMDTLNKGHQIKTVYRHLINGDVLLLNRQPTLHKPSIMAHKARILPGEKTLRLHYANCKCYNADFDGDEMNAHFPQSELSRSEAYTLALVDNQYLVPKDGTPLSGLIQDHVISGCLMSIRGRFFNRNDYQELVYSALVNQTSAIKTLPPSLLKPEVLWSGKQIISTVIINIIPQGEYLLNLDSKSKTSVKNWNLETARKWLAGGDELEDLDMTESEVIIRSGELLCGILDKAHYGSSQYGLVHCCQELYGGSVSVKLLTAFSRLFTYFLQFHGFTLGIEDILVLSKANKKRKKLIKASTKVGDEYTCKALSVDEALGKDYLTGKMREAHFSRNDLKQKQIDMVAKEMTDRFNNEINTVCLPSGLLKKFPHNNLQLMVQSGAKGSTVNTMQISGLLGQIELEGRRPPLMISGHSLPSFLPYETSPRSRGFVTGRFLTGIRPQEYFFHCMAGREGLIDTAVKTSRSGYLQRCLIKHLEGIVINYDMTVRDSDGSIIQFLYGDDGLDILKTQFMKPSQLSFLNENMKAMINHDQTDQLKGLSDLKSVSKLKKKIKKRRKAGFTKSLSSSYGFLLFSRGYKNGGKSEKDFNIKSGRSNYAEKICSDWRKLDAAEKDVYTSQMLHIPDPVISVHRPDRNFSSVTERLDEMISDYLKSNKTKVDESEFKEMFYLKAIRAICEPGEAVGLLAAQSIGEPSTQMTLNTFHFAGRGEMNVTLGIPRLREILMVASANIATPSMIVPLKENCYLEGDRLRLKMNKIYLNDLLETVTIEETINIKSSSMHYRDYKLKIKFLPFKVYKDKYFTTPSKNLKFIETYFLKILCNGIKQKLLSMAESKFVSVGSSKKAATFNDMTSNAENLELPPTANDENSSDEEGQGDEDTTAAKLKSRHDQDQEYDESDGDDVSDLSDEEQHDSSMKQEPEDEEDEAESLNKSVDRSKKDKKILKEKEMRIHDVLVSHNWVVGYNFDHKKEQWCEITLRFDLEGSKFDMAAVFEEVAKKTVVHQVDKINKALLTPDDEPDPKLTVDGVNITEMFKHGEILDLNRLYSNHIHEVANSYGIEAARNVIVKEVVNVFGVYGIEVDRRHLSLIADYMTFEGSYKPFNRVGMESNASPIQQMTFETTLQFLKSAVLSGYEDQLNSPSSRIVVGKLVGGGTGSFELLQKPYQTDSFQYNDTCFSKQKA